MLSLVSLGYLILHIVKRIGRALCFAREHMHGCCIHFVCSCVKDIVVYGLLLGSLHQTRLKANNCCRKIVGLKRGLSLSIMDKADEFAMDTSKRERAILINIAIDQG